MVGGVVKGGVGIGGMCIKIEVVEKVVLYGIDIYIINGFIELLFNMLLVGENLGMYFKFYVMLM